MTFPVHPSESVLISLLRSLVLKSLFHFSQILSTAIAIELPQPHFRVEVTFVYLYILKRIGSLMALNMECQGLIPSPIFEGSVNFIVTRACRFLKASSFRTRSLFFSLNRLARSAPDKGAI